MRLTLFEAIGVMWEMLTDCRIRLREVPLVLALIPGTIIGLCAGARFYTPTCDLAKAVERTIRRRSIRSAPLDATYLFFLFLDAKNCDALVGDLDERYRLICKRFGARRANFWYWTMALRSVGPVAWAWAKKLALKPAIGIIAWMIAKGILGHDSSLGALVEVWKKLRS